MEVTSLSGGQFLVCDRFFSLCTNESLLSTGPLNAIPDPEHWNCIWYGPVGEPVFGQQSPMELMFDSATGLGDPMVGFESKYSMSLSSTETIESYFDDPSLL